MCYNRLMKLVVGFGNPGDKYNFTRHNFGFLALDFYFKIKGYNWQPHEKYDAIFAKIDDNIYIKPQTFYNDQGLSIKKFADFYKISPEDILILCDDFNLAFGTLRYRAKGSAGGNNGLKSTIEQLKTDQFPRLRLGTGNDKEHRKLGDTNFVLGRFTPEEKDQLPVILKEIAKRLDELIS